AVAERLAEAAVGRGDAERGGEAAVAEADALAQADVEGVERALDRVAAVGVRGAGGDRSGEAAGEGQAAQPARAAAGERLQLGVKTDEGAGAVVVGAEVARGEAVEAQPARDDAAVEPDGDGGLVARSGRAGEA